MREIVLILALAIAVLVALESSHFIPSLILRLLFNFFFGGFVGIVASKIIFRFSWHEVFEYWIKKIRKK